MAIDSEIKYAFQDDKLKEHGEFLLNLFRDTIKDKDIRVSDDLLNSLSYELFREGDNRGIRFSFEEYGRFLEIRKNRMRKRNQFTTNTNSSVWGIKENKIKIKDVNWYSKNAYGSINRLIAIIMYEMTDQEIDRIKKALAQKITISL